MDYDNFCVTLFSTFLGRTCQSILWKYFSNPFICQSWRETWSMLFYSIYKVKSSVESVITNVLVQQCVDVLIALLLSVWKPAVYRHITESKNVIWHVCPPRSNIYECMGGRLRPKYGQFDTKLDKSGPCKDTFSYFGSGS